MRGIDELIHDLSRLGIARNRAIDHELRTITITDEEALVIVAYLKLGEREHQQRHDLGDAQARSSDNARESTTCSVCGRGFTIDEWDCRHTDPSDELREVHEHCCSVCS